jgi:tetratricopeptide (TPR) repeat protein
VGADAEYVPALVALGRLYHRQRRMREAFPVYRRALELAPGDAEANEGIADLLQAAGHPMDAHAARARAFRSRGLPLRAVAEYEALARQPQHDVDAVLEMSLVLVQVQKTPKAARAVESALARHPRETALYERLAVLQLLLSDRAQAQRRCAEWQRLEPRSLRPVWVMGKIVDDGGDMERAIRLLQEAVEGEPGNMEFAATLAETLLKRGSQPDLLRARELLQRVTASPVADAKSYSNLGQVLWRLKEPEAARWAFLRSLDLDPNVAETYASLVRLARELHQPEQVRFWSEIVRNVEERLRQELLRSRRTWDRPDDPDGHREMALFLIQSGELRKAESQLQEALRERPGWPEVEQLRATVRRTRELL